MTQAERDRLRAEALRLCAEAAIAAGGDLDFARGSIVKALLRRGAGRTFAYDVVRELMDGGAVELELRRRGSLRPSAEKPDQGGVSTAVELDAQLDPIAAALAQLDRVGELLIQISDHHAPARGTDRASDALILEALRAAEAAEALLRGALVPETAA